MNDINCFISSSLEPRGRGGPFETVEERAEAGAVNGVCVAVDAMGETVVTGCVAAAGAEGCRGASKSAKQPAYREVIRVFEQHMCCVVC